MIRGNRSRSLELDILDQNDHLLQTSSIEEVTDDWNDWTFLLEKPLEQVIPRFEVKGDHWSPQDHGFGGDGCELCFFMARIGLKP
jgi:hypothetical protein